MRPRRKGGRRGWRWCVCLSLCADNVPWGLGIRAEYVAVFGPALAEPAQLGPTQDPNARERRAVGGSLHRSPHHPLAVRTARHAPGGVDTQHHAAPPVCTLLFKHVCVSSAAACNVHTGNAYLFQVVLYGILLVVPYVLAYASAGMSLLCYCMCCYM